MFDRIDQQRPTDDGYQRLQDWQELATVWAQYLPGRGTERRDAAMTQARLPAIFRIRWSPRMATVVPRDRLIFEGKAFMIESVVEIGRRQGIEIVATAEV